MLLSFATIEEVIAFSILFEHIWWILEGQDYPRLWWEVIGEN
jgi:hypothetical protein